MAGLRRSIRSLAFVAIVASCGAPAPTVTPIATSDMSAPPTETARPTPAPVESPVTTPVASPTSSPTAPPSARLQVSGSGSCQAMNYGGCWPVLLLEQAPARELFDWVPSDADLEFEHSGFDDYPNIAATGPPENAPRSLAPGHWAVGLGIGQSSDYPGTPDWGTVICVREFDVTDATTVVRIEAEFAPECAITVAFEWNEATPEPPYPFTVPVPPWTPPDGGILDDCHYRTVIFHIDLDGRPWYEDVDTGERIDFPYGGFAVNYSDGQTTLVDPRGRDVLSQWDVTEVMCVLQAGDVAWVGDPDEPWRPWQRALGDSAAAAARFALQFARGHMGGPPPAATTLTSSTVASLDREMLRQLDAEIAQTGGDRWSLIGPGWYLSDEAGGPGKLLDELNGQDSVRNSLDDFEWFFTGGDEDLALGADGWGVRRAWRLETSGPRIVWGPDETLTVWEDCSKLIVPSITPSAFDSGVETGIDPEGGIVTAYVYDPDGDDFTLVVVDYRDERCREHAVMGPIIEHLLTDLVGRLVGTDLVGPCSMLVSGGEMWVVTWPVGYRIDDHEQPSLIGPDGTVIANEGDLIGLAGTRSDAGSPLCMAGTRFDATEVVFVELATP